MRLPRQRRHRTPQQWIMENILMLAGALVLLTPLAANSLEQWRQQRMVQPFEQNSPVVVAPDAARPFAAETTPASPSASPSAPPPADDRPQQGYLVEIPSIKVKHLVMADITDAALAKGPGHYPTTPLPGTGNSAMAGHRTVKGRPSYFYALDKLKAGDPIRIAYPDRDLEFVVERVYMTSPFDLSVLDPTPYPTLTLTTCDPPGGDERRLIVRARLVKVEAAINR